MSELKELQAVFDRNNFVILDTETTGLNDGEICQIAVIDPQGNPLLYTKVKTVQGIPGEAQRIHGIGDADVADAPTFAQIAPTLKSIIQGKDVVVYNASYDRRMLSQSAELAGLQKTEWFGASDWYCAMEAYAEFYGEWNDYHGNYRWQRLTFAARNCGCSRSDAHDALGDCLMTLGVIRHMFKAGE